MKKRTLKQIESDIIECYAELEFSEGKEKKLIQDKLKILGDELHKRLPKLTADEFRQRGVRLQLNAVFGI